MTCAECGLDSFGRFCGNCGATTNPVERVDAAELDTKPAREHPVAVSPTKPGASPGGIKSLVSRLRGLERGPKVILALISVTTVAVVLAALASGASSTTPSTASGASSTPRTKATTVRLGCATTNMGLGGILADVTYTDQACFDRAILSHYCRVPPQEMSPADAPDSQPRITRLAGGDQIVSATSTRLTTGEELKFSNTILAENDADNGVVLTCGTAGTVRLTPPQVAVMYKAASEQDLPIVPLSPADFAGSAATSRPTVEAPAPPTGPSLIPSNSPWANLPDAPGIGQGGESASVTGAPGRGCTPSSGSVAGYSKVTCHTGHPSKGLERGGVLDVGSQWVVCQKDLGRTNPVFEAGQSNSWWFWTLSDDGIWDWFPETALKEGASDSAVNGIAVCN